MGASTTEAAFPLEAAARLGPGCRSMLVPLSYCHGTVTGAAVNAWYRASMRDVSRLMTRQASQPERDVIVMSRQAEPSMAALPAWFQTISSVRPVVWAAMWHNHQPSRKPGTVGDGGTDKSELLERYIS